MEQFITIELYGWQYHIGDLGTILKYTGKVMRKDRDKYGYDRIYIRRKGISKIMFIHRLVAMAFIPNPHNKPQVNHINGIKDDNRAVNLEWVTNQENIIHSFKLGRKPSITCGEDVKRRKLNNVDIPVIRALVKEGKTLNFVANKFNVHISTIYNISIRKKWKHIP